MGNKYGQASVEYIFVVALALLLIVPGTVVFYQYTTTSQHAVVNSQIYKIGNDILSSADMMYSVGENSWQTLRINFPESVKSLEVYNTSSGSELVITHGDSYTSDALFVSSNTFRNSTHGVNCNSGCPIPIRPGPVQLRVESNTGGIIVFRVIG